MERPDPDELWVPCLREWTPRTCKGYDQRSPVNHRCTMPRGIPHVCRCSRRCNHNLVNGWHWSLFRSYDSLMSATLLRRQLEKRIVQARIDKGCPNCGWPWSEEDIKQDRPRVGVRCSVCTNG